MKNNRRTFIKQTSQATLGFGLFGLTACSPQKKEKPNNLTTIKTEKDLFFKISLAQWSLHRMINEGQLDHLDYAAFTKKEFDINAVEYVNQFFKNKAKDTAYLADMNKRAADHGVKNLIVMIDGEGNLGDTDETKRKTAVENHYKWVDAAHTLGCHSIRVNAYGEGEMPDVQNAAIQSLGTLADYASKAGLNVIVENHGSYSSNGEWLAGVMKQVNKSNCGTLPDFGNFCVKKSGPGFYDGDCMEEYDRYKGVTELMPFAKAVSAKSHDFDDEGNETNTDYLKMMKIVKDAGYRGYVGVEYEGSGLSEVEGVKATKKLLEKVGKALS